MGPPTITLSAYCGFGETPAQVERLQPTVMSATPQISYCEVTG
jgi:hypothetical protein